MYKKQEAVKSNIDINVKRCFYMIYSKMTKNLRN